MSQNTDDFYNEMEEHSKIKVEVYQKYLQAYFAIMQHVSKFSEINLYESHCGRGVYADKNKGSAILLYEEALESVNKYPGKPLLFNLYLNDVDSSNIESLKSVLSSFEQHDRINVHFSTDDFKDFISRSKSTHTKNSHNFYFIDPYGYKGVTKDLINDVVERENTECLIFLPISHMYRFVTKTINEENYNNGALRDFVDSFFSKEEQETLKVQIKDEKIDAFIKAVRYALFRDNFNSDTFKYFSSALKIKTNKANYNALFFISSHPYGMDKMLEVNWNIADDGYNASPEPKINQLTLFHDKNYNEYKEEIIKQFKECPANFAITNRILYLWGLTQGQKCSLTAKVIQELETEGLIEVEAIGFKRRGSFVYINYESTHRKDKIKKLSFRWRNLQ